MIQQEPLLSVVLTTHDRTHFLPMALACYRHQTYAHRELIVVDDSVPPIDAAPVIAVGGRLIRMEPGTPLGVKLNRGFAEARGQLLHKMDDDDWYAPDFLARMVAEYLKLQHTLYRPTTLCMVTYPFFDLIRWELRMHEENEMSGATFVFARLDWVDAPFRPIGRAVDIWFIHDGVVPYPVEARDSFIQVRHRGHLWLEQPDGTPMDALIERLPVVSGGPESRLPDWAIAFYRDVQAKLLAEDE